jgi:cytochrome c oxidase subunit 1
MSMVKKIALLLILAIFSNVLLFGFIWFRHAFVSGLNPFLNAISFWLFLLISIVVVIFLIRRLVRYCKGRFRFTPTTFFVLGVLIFLSGDVISELAFGSYTLDIQVRDTYYVIAHTHLMLFIAFAFLAFSFVHFIYPRVTGRKMNTPMAYIHFAVTFVAAYLLCWPVHYEGVAGMPRRYMYYSNLTSLDRFSGINVFARRATMLLIGAQVLFLINLIYSGINGEKWQDQG